MNIYSRIQDLCKVTGDTMYSLSKHSGVSESVLSRLKNQQSKLSKKNLILLANYFCVNEDWLETGAGSKSAPGLVKDTLIHDERLHQRILELCQCLFGENDNDNTDIWDVYSVINASSEIVASKTNLEPERIWQILYNRQFPSYSETLAFAKISPNINANWLFLGEGEMFRSNYKDIERLNKLVDTITTLQDAINAKSETIAALNERIKELESQIKK